LVWFYALIAYSMHRDGRVKIHCFTESERFLIGAYWRVSLTVEASKHESSDTAILTHELTCIVTAKQQSY